MMMIELLGFIGTILVISAYIPQILRLIKTKNAVSISISAWIIWLIGTIMILSHALTIGDRVFIFFQSLSLILVTIILFLALRYRKKRRLEEISSGL